jgi:predicted RecB family nuclease
MLNQEDSIFLLLEDNGTISESALRRLNERGYTTVGSVGLIGKPFHVAKGLGIQQDMMIHIIHTAQYRTRMVIERRMPRFLSGDLIWFDIETDLNWNKIWLIGAVDAKENKFYKFYANTWNDEHDMLKEFDKWLKVRQNRPLMYYSCNGFDVRITRNACARSGLYQHAIFTQPEQDICYTLRRSYYMPTKNRKLKTMARFLGYDMSLENQEGYMDGLECAQHYIRHVMFNEPLNSDVFLYNENDVWMLPFIVNRLAEIAVVQDVG